MWIDCRFPLFGIFRIAEQNLSQKLNCEFFFFLFLDRVQFYFESNTSLSNNDKPTQTLYSNILFHNKSYLLPLQLFNFSQSCWKATLTNSAKRQKCFGWMKN